MEDGIQHNRLGGDFHPDMVNQGQAGRLPLAFMPTVCQASAWQPRTDTQIQGGRGLSGHAFIRPDAAPAPFTGWPFAGRQTSKLFTGELNHDHT